MTTLQAFVPGWVTSTHPDVPQVVGADASRDLVDALTGHRHETWTWRLLDHQDRDLGVLSGVTEGRLSLDVTRETRGEGSLTWAGLGVDAPDWRTVRIQPWYHALCTAATGEQVRVSWPFAVMLPSTERVTHGPGHVTVPVALYDKTLILRRTKTLGTYGVEAGTIVAPLVVSLVTEHAGGAVAVEESSTALRSAMTWEAGTPWLTIVNELLDAAGYFALWADGDGVLRSERYREPGSRPLQWAFTDGHASIYRPDLEQARSWFDTPNRVTLVSRADPDTPAMVATAENRDVSDPLSYDRLGYWVDHQETDVEAADSWVLQVLADQTLASMRRRSSTITLTHAPLPLDINGRVTVRRDGGGAPFSAAGVVRSVTVDATTAGSLWTTRVLEVTA